MQNLLAPKYLNKSRLPGLGFCPETEAGAIFHRRTFGRTSAAKSGRVLLGPK